MAFHFVRFRWVRPFVFNDVMFAIALSKPLLRDDGVLLVGTSLPSNTGGGPSNRIFVTNYKTFQASQPPPFLQTQAVHSYI